MFTVENLGNAFNDALSVVNSVAALMHWYSKRGMKSPNSLKQRKKAFWITFAQILVMLPISLSKPK